MTPSQAAKRLGCQSLAQVSKVSGVPIQTLRDWHESRPWVFEACCMRVARNFQVKVWIDEPQKDAQPPPSAFTAIPPSSESDYQEIPCNPQSK